MWYVPEKYISIVDRFDDKTKGELEEFLGYSVGKSGKKKEELLSEAKERGKWVDNRFVIVNFDILDEFYTISRAASEDSINKLLENNPLLRYLYKKKSLIIVDEAHKLSNNTSTRYKIINDLIKRTNPDCIWLSTGTPVTNMPENLYCLLKLLDAPIASDWNYYTERYCGAKKIYAKGEFNRLKDIWFKNHGKSGWKDLSTEEVETCKNYIDAHARKINIMEEPCNVDELKEIISYLYLRRTKEDVTDLPKKYIHELRYDLTAVQQAEYDKLWDEYEAAKTEEDASKELNKDLLEGAIYRSYLAVEMVPKTIKIADELINDGEKVIIACCYDNELYALRDYYKDKCVIYNGKCSLKQKDAAIKAFKEYDNVRVFIGNIVASGVGITLTNSCNLIFNSFDYVYANNSQMEDRIHRIGQKRECNIYYQMFNDTHCEHMWDIVLKKQYLSDTLIKNY
jgi:SNF2 family DNA or RNA helicase